MSNPDEPTLTLRDKLDWSWLVLNNLRTITDITKSEKYDVAIVIDLIEVLEAYIPKKFRDIDPYYNKEIAEATENIQIDMRPEFGGELLNEETCKKLNIEPYKFEKRINHIKKLTIIIGLLNRFGIVAKKDIVERIGHPEDFPDEPNKIPETITEQLPG